MSRINPVDRNAADQVVRKTFDVVQKRLGLVPNMMRTMAQAPRVLEGYLGFSGALGVGVLPAALQEQIALVVAEANACDYCLSAHSTLGRGAGLSDEQINASRQARAADPKTRAALHFALAILQHRGGVSDEQFAEIRGAGFSEAEIVEIIANVALNVFTNYFNRAADTDIDFPEVRAGAIAA